MKIKEEYSHWEPLGAFLTRCCVIHLFIHKQTLCSCSKHNINLFTGCETRESSGASRDLATAHLSLLPEMHEE